ncbi:MAG: ATP-binding protein [Thermodesulfobacteriota bacterium]
MIGPFSLRSRIYSALIALVLITLVGGLVMVWYTYRMERLFSSLIDRNVAAFQAAEALRSALANQKGFVSYYFQDGDPTWLRHLGEYRQVFKERLVDAKSLAETEAEKTTVDRIESEYRGYITLKDRAIEHYRAAEKESGSKLHKEVREHFFKVLELCDQFKAFHGRQIDRVRAESLSQAGRLRVIAGSAVLCALFLAVLLSFVLVNQVLAPVRRLALEADREAGNPNSEDEVKALSRSVRGLLEDFDFTQTELEKSREHLLAAEKLAAAGKLAAGMAHSIRNPLTSVKMRLFSLQRALSLSRTQSEDFQVISEEIHHVDTIVQNFLEFARPPKLRMQRVSPSEIVDLALRLLQHRLELGTMEARLERTAPLPETEVDPERLKEALVNILENACDAVANEGSVVIREEEARLPQGRRAVIRISDNGPGIPEAIQKRVFEPFFSTKEEGSGLGLSIAARIVEEHGGTLELQSRAGEGATFVISLPIKEVPGEQDSDH